MRHCSTLLHWGILDVVECRTFSHTILNNRSVLMPEKMYSRGDARYEKLVSSLADSAVVYAAQLDLKRTPNGHIWKALDQAGIHDHKERSRMAGVLCRELTRRGFTSPAQVEEEQNRLLQEVREQIMLEDAYEHERQLDPQERDTDDADLM